MTTPRHRSVCVHVCAHVCMVSIFGCAHTYAHVHAQGNVEAMRKFFELYPELTKNKVKNWGRARACVYVCVLASLCVVYLHVCRSTRHAIYSTPRDVQHNTQRSTQNTHTCTNKHTRARSSSSWARATRACTCPPWQKVYLDVLAYLSYLSNLSNLSNLADLA
jgi:hypothetical protein